MAEMRYVAGFDGGGTKTVCILADERGRIAGVGRAGGSNHQIGGLPAAIDSLSRCFSAACAQAGVEREAVSFAYLGLAGADVPEDFALLNARLPEALGPVPFEVVNDCWIAFYAQAPGDWGAVSVCGTGSNLAVRTPEGKTYITRALNYMLGNYGGGLHLTEMAMHAAFRCAEGTGEDTLLALRLPAVCRCANMEELALRTYRNGEGYLRDFNIPRLVFQLAAEGDAVCLRILNGMGAELGEMVGRLIGTAGLADRTVPVVLAGTLYARDENRFLLNPLVQRLRNFAPKAETLPAQGPPVTGAVFRALESVGRPLPPEQKRRLRAQANGMTA